MERYQAVVTTGIYCRPDCSARPDPANVRPFTLAAAAEAQGFRACLRCRPYRSPEALPTDGPELVCRAVGLITDGALDGATEAELAARLAVSARHLRRLFTEHAGTTPDQLARSRRTHFARRLLDDTDLTVTEVAFAAGFGSARQLNRACHDVFRASPSQLRARRRRADRLVADGGLPLRLSFRGPLDWDAMLSFLAARATPGVERVQGGCYRRTIDVAGHPGVIEVVRGGSDHADHADHLVLTAHLPYWEGLIHLVDRARRAFALDAPVDQANAHLAGDPIVGPSVRARPGLRVPGAWDGFEVGVRAIVGQQVSVAGATTILGRIVERAGRPVPGLTAMGLDRLFPTPSQLAGADLSGLGLTTSRERALRELAAAVRDGDVVLDRSRPLADLERELTRLPGVGPWTAQYVAMRLGEHDAWPTGDRALVRSLERLGAASDPAGLADLARRWSPWRATAAMHLWTVTGGRAADARV